MSTKMARKDNLSVKQRRFVDEYLIDLNATQAAIRAGYSVKAAKVIGHENLTKPYIAEHITQRMAARSVRTQITQDMVVRELAKIAFADIRNAVKWSPTMGEMLVDDGSGELVPVQTNGVMLVPSDEVDDSTARAISEITQTRDGIKIKFHDKLAALVSIGRHLGMFNDKMKLQGDENAPIQTVTRVIMVPRKEQAVVETRLLDSICDP
jgi:phage terminase small subunit